MRANACPWIIDDTPTGHRIVRVLLFLTSFSWTFNPIQDYMAESTPVEKIVTRMIPMLIVGVYAVTSEHRNKIGRLLHPVFWPVLWYVLVGVLCGMTGFLPALCVWKGAEVIILLMWLAVSCRDADSTRREFVAIARLVEILLWATIVLAVINPKLGLLRSAGVLPWLRGYLPNINPNALGFISLWVFVRLLFLPARARAVRIVIACGVLLCAQSRTAYGVAFCTVIVFIFDGLRTRQILRVSVAFVFALLGLAFALGWLDVLLKVVMRGESASELQSLSGRTDYWAFALEHVDWFGGGLATGSRGLIFIGEDTFHRGSVNLHNSHIEALMGAGYVGAIPYILLIAVNILRQSGHMLTKQSVAESIFFVGTIVFAARSMTSIVLALFSFDQIMLMLFYFWLHTRNISNTDAPVRGRPQPKPYRETLREVQKKSEDLACQSAHSE